MKLILVKQGECKMIGRICKASQPTVRKALRGDESTDLLRRIRKVAIERGGLIQQ